MITADPVMDRYTVGVLLTLHCVVTLSSTVNTPLTLQPVWQREGIVLTSGNQLIVGQFSITEDHVYTSSLEFQPLTTSFIGNETLFECEAKVLPQSNSFVTGTTANSFTTITVEGKSDRLD